LHDWLRRSRIAAPIRVVPELVAYPSRDRENKEAEGMGFEPTIHFWTPDFESGRWPIRLPSSDGNERINVFTLSETGNDGIIGIGVRNRRPVMRFADLRPSFAALPRTTMRKESGVEDKSPGSRNGTGGGGGWFGGYSTTI
jgi:hypothetical protein